MNGDGGLFVVLRGRGAHVHEGLLGVQVQIGLKQLGKLAPTKTRVNGGKINDLASTGNGQQPLHFLVGEGAAVAHLPSVGLNLLDEPERIFLQPFVSFHPAQKTGQRGQVVVKRLGCLASLATAPLKERIGSHTRQSDPSAFLEKFPNLFIDDVNVLGIATHGGKIGEVVFQMIEQRRLLGNTLRFGRQKACGLKLPVLNNLLQFLLGNALVGRMQRNVGNLRVAFEPEATTVKTGDFGVTVLGSLGTEYSADHKFIRLVVALDGHAWL